MYLPSPKFYCQEILLESFSQPDPKAFNILLGSSNNISFMPGGFDDEQEDSFSLSDHLNITDKFDDEEEIRFLDFNGLCENLFLE